MGSTFDRITPDLRTFIEAQHMFFVATAPLSADGHVNLSPKGLETFRVLDEHTVAYLDLTGSGNETSAHISENARITLMFCAFEGNPKILRLYGRGQTVLPGSDEWDRYIALFRSFPGIRQVIVARVDRAMTSCGFGVPRYQYLQPREELIRSSEKLGPDGMEDYRRKKNVRSIDGMLTPYGRALG